MTSKHPTMQNGHVCLGEGCMRCEYQKRSKGLVRIPIDTARHEVDWIKSEIARLQDRLVVWEGHLQAALEREAESAGPT